MTKVRITKKLVAMVMTILLLAAMVMPVAAQPNTGSITIHKLRGASIGNAQPNMTGEQLSSNDIPAGYEALEGAVFTLYRLPVDQITAMTTAVSTANTGFGSHVITLDTTTGIPSVRFNFLNGNNQNITAEATPIGERTTNGAGLATFAAPLSDGFYVLVETEAPDGVQAGSPSLIRLPLTKADGTFNYDVHVYPKNISTEGTAVKTINGIDTGAIQNGSVVDFELRGSLNSATVSSADDLRDGTTYGIAQITDIFDATFQYNNDVEVFWLNNAGAITGTALATEYYTITEDSAIANPGGRLTIKLSNHAIDHAITNNITGFGLRLTATYVGNAGVDQTTARNNMSLLVVAANADMHPPIDTGVNAPLLNILVNKETSAATGSAALQGVTFAVSKVAVPRVNYAVGSVEGDYTSTQWNHIQADYVIGANGLPITGVTNTDGELEFTNLEGYSDADGITYYLKEIATVADYQLKAETIAVIFLPKADYQPLRSEWFDDDDEWKPNTIITEEVTVVNYKLEENDADSPGFRLPLTGGAGTVAFTAGGILLMLGAVVIYLNGKRRNTER